MSNVTPGETTPIQNSNPFSLNIALRIADDDDYGGWDDDDYGGWDDDYWSCKYSPRVTRRTRLLA